MNVEKTKLWRLVIVLRETDNKEGDRLTKTVDVIDRKSSMVVMFRYCRGVWFS